jgi:hypothetical protein
MKKSNKKVKKVVPSRKLKKKVLKKPLKKVLKKKVFFNKNMKKKVVLKKQSKNLAKKKIVVKAKPVKVKSIKKHVPIKKKPGKPIRSPVLKMIPIQTKTAVVRGSAPAIPEKTEVFVRDEFMIQEFMRSNLD